MRGERISVTNNGYTASCRPHSTFPELTALTLVSPAGLSATFVPDAGMVGSSLRHAGEELLGLRGGLMEYIKHGRTFGIPLLAPWANRLVRRDFDGQTLDTRGVPGIHSDSNGLAIHGVLAGCEAWEVVDCAAEPKAARAAAELRFDPDFRSFAAFPFPHLLRVDLRVTATTLRISTTLTAIGDRPVPIAFGWHPYFAPPGADRADWIMCSPFTRELELNERLYPTGRVVSVPPRTGSLGGPIGGFTPDPPMGPSSAALESTLAELSSTHMPPACIGGSGVTYDTLFGEVPEGALAWVEGGGRRISVRYDRGYPYAVLFAPADQRLVAIEPMSAPTDPLSGHFPIRVVKPGESATSTYSIIVTEAGHSASGEAAVDA